MQESVRDAPDVIVIGAGMGGLVAAVRAQELGARVTLIEKGSAIGGTMVMSGGGIWCAKTYEGIRRLVPRGDPDLCRTLVEDFPGAIQWLEGLGFCDEGESGPFVAEGNTRPGGSLPVNTDGGAVNAGRTHGINHVVEVVQQLRGEAGARQLSNARVGVASNALGPTGGCMVLTSE